jgi:cholesterol transport system auxiliary component
VKPWIVVLAAGLCTACVGSVLRSSTPPPDRYRLAAPAGAPAAAGVAAAIAVARPTAPPSLDTDRIAVDLPGHGFDYLAGVRWADAAPRMLQQLLAEALKSGGGFATAVTAPSRVPADLLLDVEVDRFEARYAAPDSSPTVVVSIDVNLINVRSGDRLASFVSSASATASRNDRSAIVAAFQQATGEVVQATAARVARAAAGS